MNNIIIPTIDKKSLFKLCLRVLLLILFLSIVSFIILITLGYHEASKSVSYLPVIPLNGLSFKSNDSVQAEIRNSRYVLLVSENAGVQILTTRGEVLMSGLTYYSSYKGSDGKWGLDKRSVKVTSDSTISITGEGQAGVQVNILLTIPWNKSNLNVRINTHYSKPTVVDRESLVASFNIPVSEVYKKNRQVDAGSFDPEYWLQRQGVDFGSGERSVLIFGTTNISSLQIDTRKNLVFVNLDFSSDHPFFNILKGEAGKWIDLSEAIYNEGDERTNSFSMNIGNTPEYVPRMMLVPNGYLAGYVFTEHADGGTIRTHRAAYFGSEDITRVSDATGGFVGHRIPVTKSVFYANLAGLADPDKNIAVEDSLVLDFMDQLRDVGDYDICLHGCNATRKVVEEALTFMKKRYDSKTWIDHGMYNGIENRQSFVCDGLNRNSEYYSADLWDKYAICYFWNSALEESRKSNLKQNILKLRFYDVFTNLWRRSFSSRELSEMRFLTALKELIRRFHDKGEINSLLPDKGSSLPTPLYWQHPTRTKNFYSWVTEYVKMFGHSDAAVEEERNKIIKLISDWGVFIDHGYFVRNLYEDGVLINSDGKIVTSPYFDKILDILTEMRDKGDLYITTIRQLLDYWILIDAVSFEYMPDGSIYINNLNDKVIDGFSLAVKAGAVRIDGKVPKFRKEGDDTILWFDLAAKQRVRLQMD